MHRLGPHLADTFFGIDTRSLGAFRIALALALLIDLALRDPLRTNADMVSNHTLFCGPRASLVGGLFGTPQPFEAGVWLLGAAVAFTLLLLGCWTKLAQILSLLAVVSLNTRLALLEHGGDLLMLCIWSLVLPLGERFSIDALRASLGRRAQQTPAELNDRAPIRTPARRAYSLACCALILQLVVSYALATSLQNLPWLAMTGLAALLIVSPIATKYTRLAALLLSPALHVAGMFSTARIACAPLLIEPSHWDWLRRRAVRWHHKRLVFVDEDCGFCMLCARLLARLDVLERLEFASNADQARLPDGVTLAQADESITTLELHANGRVQRGAAACAALLRSLPFGFVLALPLQTPGLRLGAEWLYQRVAQKRLAISLWLGYGVCGVPQPTAATGSQALDPPAPGRRGARRGWRIVTEAWVALFLIAAAVCLLRQSD